MDPLSLALAGISLGKSFLDTNSAKSSAKDNIALQQANQQQQMAMLTQALSQAQSTSNDRMMAAGAQKTDQFGNTTQYDPSTGRWVTVFTPEQQKLIDQGQQKQERTNLRSAQASEDYNTQRAGYLYDRPPSEAETRAEIARLITQARGEGDRALSTLVNRQELRQQGNMPVINTGPLAGSDAGKRLAETMLQARAAALGETGTREQQHSSRYLPAMAAFEKTANTVAPIDPTGQQIIGMAQQGGQDIQSSYKDLMSAMLGAYGTGAGAMNTAAGGVNAASNALTAASAPKNEIAQYAALIKALQPTSATIKAGQLAQGVEPQASSTTYEPTYGTPATNASPFSFKAGDLDTPPDYTYFSKPKTSFDDRWYF